MVPAQSIIPWHSPRSKSPPQRRAGGRSFRSCLTGWAPASSAASHDLNPHARQPNQSEISVVMPCLNEADTLGTCLEKAFRALREAGIAGEVIVADNGSTDGSVQIAEQAGARVVPVAKKRLRQCAHGRH